MAIAYTKYPIANVSQITAAIKAALDASGMYDSVTISESTITIADGGTTYLTLTIGGTCSYTATTDGGVTRTGNGFSGTGAVGVGVVGSNVIVTIFGEWRCSFIFAQSSAGRNIIVIGEPVSGYYYPICIANDAAALDVVGVTENSTSGRGMPWKTTYNAMTFAGICGPSLAEGMASPVGVYHLDSMPNYMLWAWTNTTSADIYRVTVNGKECLTDGYFVCVDE